MFSGRTVAAVLLAAAPGLAACLLTTDLDRLHRARSAADDADINDARDARDEEAHAENGPDASRDGGYRDEVMRDGPLLYLRLGERQGTVAKDEMGTANGSYSASGFAYGTPGAIAGDPDTAMTFTDGTGMITMPPGADFDGMKPFTAELWFRAGPQNSISGWLIDHQIWSPRQGWLMRAGTLDITFERAASNGGLDHISAPAPSSGNWHHMVGVFDGRVQTLFLDGQVRDAQTAQISLAPYGMTYLVGHKNSTGNDGSFVGDLDELAIYGKALTQARIQAHYAAAK